MLKESGHTLGHIVWKNGFNFEGANVTISKTATQVMWSTWVDLAVSTMTQYWLMQLYNRTLDVEKCMAYN